MLPKFMGPWLANIMPIDSRLGKQFSETKIYVTEVFKNVSLLLVVGAERLMKPPVFNYCGPRMNDQ